MLVGKDEAISVLSISMSTAASALTSDGLSAAVDAATSELNWSFPISDSKKCLWLIKRATRHACFILWLASAQKFKYKQVNLQHRFDHYEKLIKYMDTEYEIALTSESTMFANVEPYKLFGTVVGAGFHYDSIGNDITSAYFLRYLNLGQ
jgi:hypothetical protein